MLVCSRKLRLEDGRRLDFQPCADHGVRAYPYRFIYEHLYEIKVDVLRIKIIILWYICGPKECLICSSPTKKSKFLICGECQRIYHKRRSVGLPRASVPALALTLRMDITDFNDTI